MTGIAALAILLILFFAEREWRWRRDMRREMPEEVRLGIVSDRDLLALAGFDRLSRDWIADGAERRLFRYLAGRLARAKTRQRRTSDARRRLAQVEILTLRTRMRQARFEGGTGGRHAGGHESYAGIDEIS